MKRLLCEAFCASLEARQVPVGWAVETPFTDTDGDPLVIYLVRDTESGWRVEDDGCQVPMLEACGVDLTRKTRSAAFNYLLAEYGVLFDSEERTLHTTSIVEKDLGRIAVRFAEFLVRLQDLALLSVPNVRNLFREDAIQAIHQAFSAQAEIEERAELSEGVAGLTADIIVRPPNNKPALAIFIGTSEERALSALVMKMEAEKYAGIPAYVALLVEQSKKNPIADRTLGLAWSRLDRVLSFRGTEKIAMNSLAKLVDLSPALEVLQ